jgi:hypothetical protein
MRLAISSFFSCKAKWPASSRWIFGIRKIALERLRTGADERGIVPPPDHKNRWPVLVQPRLPRRIRSDVCPVVVQQIGLDLALAGSRQVGVLVSPGIRVITFGMRGAEGVTLFGRCERYERIEASSAKANDATQSGIESVTRLRHCGLCCWHRVKCLSFQPAPVSPRRAESDVAARSLMPLSVRSASSYAIFTLYFLGRFRRDA